MWRWRRGGAGAPLRHLTLSPQAPGLSPSEEDAGLGPAASRMRRRARLEIPESAFPADLGRRGGAPAAALRRGAGGGEPGFARAAGTPAIQVRFSDCKFRLFPFHYPNTVQE